MARRTARLTYTHALANGPTQPLPAHILTSLLPQSSSASIMPVLRSGTRPVRRPTLLLKGSSRSRPYRVACSDRKAQAGTPTPILRRVARPEFLHTHRNSGRYRTRRSGYSPTTDHFFKAHLATRRATRNSHASAETPGASAHAAQVAFALHTRRSLRKHSQLRLGTHTVSLGTHAGLPGVCDHTCCFVAIVRSCLVSPGLTP